jgi:restriction system protein
MTRACAETERKQPCTAHISKRVVLIDGQALANLMIRHRVSVRVKDVYEVREIDDSYFAE